jgi:DNA invertase Pin-like site-specific DNA recombinase
MKKVVLFIRKSTLLQEFDHQENLLIEVCKKYHWEIVDTIRETISGTKKNEEREGITQLKNVVLEKKPQIVVCWEISRISRTSLGFHQLLSFLTDNKVSLFIQNLNIHTLDDTGKENHITGLILSLMAEIAKMETLTLKTRVKVALQNLKDKGVVLGRPKDTKDNKEKTLKKYPEVIKYLDKGLSIREVSRLTNTSINTTLKVSKLIRLSVTDSVTTAPFLNK